LRGRPGARRRARPDRAPARDRSAHDARGDGVGNAERAAVWESSATLWTDVVVKHPTSYLAWGNLGQALAARGDFASALPCFSRALDLAGGRPHRAKILFDRAAALQEAGDQERADADYTLGLSTDPDNAKVLVNRGNARDALGRPREALADYGRAIELDPENSLAWYNKGVTLAGLGEHAAAVESFDTALRLEPGYAPGFRQRARSLEAIGRRAEAAEDRRRAARLEAAASRGGRDGR
jgi:tetratricopeptide (TPR) repeat protein